MGKRVIPIWRRSLNARTHRTFNQGIGVVTPPTLFASSSALARENLSAEGEPAALETLVVTGEKRERSLKDTASSVSLTSVRDIDRKQTSNASVAEAINGSPNVVYTDSAGVPIIRGQDTQGPNNGQNVFRGSTVPRAMINLDGHCLNYSEMFFGATSVWDVDSIEVFRGPQTTSQGANITTGAIIVNTKDPTFSPEAAHQAGIGNYHSRRSSIAVSGPLTQDFAGRLAMDYAGCDTFIDYDNPKFQDSGTDQDFRALNACAKLLWLPSGTPGLESKFTFPHNDSSRPTQEAATRPFDKLDHRSTTMSSWEQDTNTSILDVAYDLDDGIRLFNQVQYSLSSMYRTTGAGGEGDTDIRQKNAFNESRISFGEQEDRVSGMGGAYYARTRTDETLHLRGLLAFDDTRKNLGVSGELNYYLSDRWTLTTGLCYQEDCIERSGNSVLTPRPLDYQRTFSAFLPKASLAFAATPDWTVGGLVSRGYNPGGVSFNLTTRNWAYFKEETIWDYELFIRASLLDGRPLLNGDLFFMDFKDAQYNIPAVVSPGVVQSYTINAKKAHAYGMELDLNYRLRDSLRLKASAGVLRTRTDEMFGNIGYEYNEFAHSPGCTPNFGPGWDVTERLNLNAQVRYLDGYYLGTANTKAYSINAYTLTSAHVSYRLNDQVQLYGYMKNVLDDRSPTYMQENRGIGDIEASMTQPRTPGIGIKGTFQTP